MSLPAINYMQKFKAAVDGGHATWHGHFPSNPKTGTGGYTVVYFSTGTGDVEAHVHDDKGLPDNVNVYPIGGKNGDNKLATIYIKTDDTYKLDDNGKEKLQETVAHIINYAVDMQIKVSKKNSKLGKMLKKYGIAWSKVKKVPKDYAAFERLRNKKTGGKVKEQDAIYLDEALKINAGRAFTAAKDEQYDDILFMENYDDNGDISASNGYYMNMKDYHNNLKPGAGYNEYIDYNGGYIEGYNHNDFMISAIALCSIMIVLAVCCLLVCILSGAISFIFAIYIGKIEKKKENVDIHDDII